MKQLDVSVVIVNYNAGNLLQACVASCLLQTGEVIVVDNASVDGSIEALELMFSEECALQLIKSQKNEGFAAGCNKGLDATRGQYVLFLNPDCILSEGAVEALRNALVAEPDVGMAGGLLLNKDGSEQIGGRRAIPTPWRSLVRVFHLSQLSERWPRLFEDFNLHKQPLPASPIRVEAISGACMMVKREAVQDVGQ